MTDHISKTIEMVQSQIHDLERELNDKKKMINELCKLNNQQPLYADTDSVSDVKLSVRPDEYYGKALATVVQTILKRRKSMNLGAATVNEIYNEMVAGGFAFEAKNDNNAKRGLYISLGKNQVFHKLPNGSYGLSEWYPNMKKSKEVVENDGDGGEAASVKSTKKAPAKVVANGAGDDESIDEGNLWDEVLSNEPKKPKAR